MIFFSLVQIFTTSADIVGVMKLKRLRRPEHVARVRRREMSADCLWGRLKERQHFEDFGIYGTIILQWTLDQ
jgi:hypothetical protein